MISLNKWKAIVHEEITLNQKISVKTMIFVDYKLFWKKQNMNYNQLYFNCTKRARNFNVRISLSKTKVMAFRGWYPVQTNVVLGKSFAADT